MWHYLRHPAIPHRPHVLSVRLALSVTSLPSRLTLQNHSIDTEKKCARCGARLDWTHLQRRRMLIRRPIPPSRRSVLLLRIGLSLGYLATRLPIYYRTHALTTLCISHGHNSYRIIHPVFCTCLISTHTPGFSLFLSSRAVASSYFRLVSNVLSSPSMDKYCR